MHAASIHRMARDGPGVVCLHATPGTQAPWRALSERLAARWRVVVPGHFEAARNPASPAGSAPTLDDQLRALEPSFDAAGERFHLVGHSCGGALALRAALAYPERVESVAVYEPALLALLRKIHPDHPDLERLFEVVREGAEAVDRGEPEGAARRFIDFWTHSGAFDAMAPAQRAQVLATIDCIGSWWQLLSEDPTPLHTFARVRAPVLLMTGRSTRAVARCIADALLSALPGAQVVRFDGLGHMGPLTHPERVLAVIEGFLSIRRSAMSATPASASASAGRPADPSEASLMARWALDAAPARAAEVIGRAAGQRPSLPPRPSSDPRAPEAPLFPAPPV